MDVKALAQVEYEAIKMKALVALRQSSLFTRRRSEMIDFDFVAGWRQRRKHVTACDESLQYASLDVSLNESTCF